MTDRSGQWSRCSVTGTGLSSARVVKMSNSCLRPYALTVLTEVCRMTGARSSAAAARTASIDRSLMMLNAATP